MQFILWVIDLFLHLDKHLTATMTDFGVWTYVLLFAVIFLETGFVVTPFLPGDSLLFAAGALAALDNSPLNVFVLFVALALAAILGDTVNYWIGHKVGPRVFRENTRFLKKEYLDRAHVFYQKYGGKTIFLGRFIPIIRTFVPFVAGIGEMSYPHFIGYNVIGGITWAALCLTVGYFFGNIPVVKDNFSLVIIAIVVISVMPAVIEYIRGRKNPTPATSPAPVDEPSEEVVK